MPLSLAKNMLEQRWLSIKDAAFRSSLSVEMIKRWLRRGVLKAHKAGRRTLIDVQQLDRVIVEGVE
jgi:excisionase family DNA binding protein